MSFFVSAVGSMQLVNYLGLAVNVPVVWLKDGYLSIDKDGTVWAYAGMPSIGSERWVYTPAGGTSLVVDCCVIKLDTYANAFKGSPAREYFIAKDVWENSLVKISECPLINY